MASRQRCEVSHCSGPVKNIMNENEMILIFSTNHLLLQKFLEDRLCLKDALAVLLKIGGHPHLKWHTKKTNIFQQNVTKPNNRMSECCNGKRELYKTKWFITHLHMSCHNLAEEGKLLRRERDHLIVFEDWHYVDFPTMTSRGYGFIQNF